VYLVPQRRIRYFVCSTEIKVDSDAQGVAPASAPAASCAVSAVATCPNDPVPASSLGVEHQLSHSQLAPAEPAEAVVAAAPTATGPVTVSLLEDTDESPADTDPALLLKTTKGAAFMPRALRRSTCEPSCLLVSVVWKVAIAVACKTYAPTRGSWTPKLWIR